MAINVDTVYKTVLLILNKEQRGYMTPDEFNKIGSQVQLEIFKNYFNSLNRQLRVPQADIDYADRHLSIDADISIFETFGNATYNAVGSYWELPTVDTYSNNIIYSGDLLAANQVYFYELGTVVYNNEYGKSIELQRLQRNEFYNIQLSPLTESTKSFPTYLYENQKLYVRPTTITSTNQSITVNFLRTPKNITWNYSTGGQGQYIFNANGSQNFELSNPEQTEVITKILFYAGVIIRDPQIIQVAASQIQKEEANSKS